MVNRSVLSAAVLAAVIGCQPTDKPEPEGSTSLSNAAVDADARLVSLSVPNMT